MSDKYSTENLRLQIEAAARGSVDGTLKDWPYLESALHSYGFTLSEDTPADLLRAICHEIVTKNDERYTRGPLVDDPLYPFSLYACNWLGTIVTSCDGSTLVPRPDEEKKANVRRMKACWNKFIGVPTATIEALVALPNVYAVLTSETQGNTSGTEQILLDALEGIKAYAQSIGEGTVGYLVDEGISKFNKGKEAYKLK